MMWDARSHWRFHNTAKFRVRCCGLWVWEAEDSSATICTHCHSFCYSLILKLSLSLFRKVFIDVVLCVSILWGQVCYWLAIVQVKVTDVGLMQAIGCGRDYYASLLKSSLKSSVAWWVVITGLPNLFIYAKRRYRSQIYHIYCILCLVHFAKNDEDWFGFGKLNVFLSCKCLV